MALPPEVRSLRRDEAIGLLRRAMRGPLRPVLTVMRSRMWANLMVSGCYTLHVYCRFSTVVEDRPVTKAELDARPTHMSGSEFLGRNFREARLAALRAGWVIRGRAALCPECAQHGAWHTKTEAS